MNAIFRNRKESFSWEAEEDPFLAGIL